MKTLGSKELVKIFDEQLKSVESYKLIGELNNPCHIRFNDVEYYVYIKNLSSAYFTNPDVSRAQLTGVETLDGIKKSETMFILIGYDVENDVYAAWNPHFAKQRIGTAASPSFYSRFSLQEEAARTNDFVLKELKNDGAVLIFPRNKTGVFMASISKFFSNTSDYVAMGSKKRADANASYKLLINPKHLDVEFTKYLSNQKLDASVVRTYVWAIKYLIAKSLFSSNRRIFLSYNSIKEYRDATKIFLSVENIKKMDILYNGLFTNALNPYIEFLIKKYGKKEAISDIPEEDYENPFIDTCGNLTRITNPKLIELLRADLDTEYPRPMGAYATIERFYGNRFPKMQMHHWLTLFKQINWSAPYDNEKKPQQTHNHAKRGPNKNLSVLLPNGNIIYNDKAVDTFLEVLLYAGIEKVRELGITMGKSKGGPLILSESNPKYPKSLKYVGNGLYVNTCSSTETKCSQLNQISKKLKLGLKIALK